MLLAVACLLAVAVPSAATGSISHPTVVSEDPANNTPRVVPDTNGVARPYVNAIAQLGDTMYAGGLFSKVYDDRANATLARSNFVMFDAVNGEAADGSVRTASPNFSGEVWAVESSGDSVYVGGNFSTVDGISRPRLVKLNADGSVDPDFNARLNNGRVMDLHIAKGMLFVGGSAGKCLMALNLNTGADTGYVDLGIADKIPNSQGDVNVQNFSISPDGNELVAVGNFMTVDGQSRKRAFMAKLGTGAASLAEWYYQPFAETCRSTTPRRLAYLSDVDFAPSGSYFVVVSTGFTWDFEDRNKTVCDAAARFNTPGSPMDPTDPENDPFRPEWINYTGGDTIWSVAVTGAAVYVQGHFQWLDNTDGVGENLDPDAVPRLGIGAIDPGLKENGGGLALGWNPGKPAKKGGRQLLATSNGLWVVSDSRRFNGEPRYGIAFAPL